MPSSIAQHSVQLELELRSLSEDSEGVKIAAGPTLLNSTNSAAPSEAAADLCGFALLE